MSATRDRLKQFDDVVARHGLDATIEHKHTQLHSRFGASRMVAVYVVGVRDRRTGGIRTTEMTGWQLDNWLSGLIWALDGAAVNLSWDPPLQRPAPPRPFVHPEV